MNPIQAAEDVPSEEAVLAFFSGSPVQGLRAIRRIYAHARALEAELARRHAGDVGKLVEDIYAQVQAGGVFSTDHEAERYLALSKLACQAANALTALSSAPVDVEELAKRGWRKEGDIRRADGKTGVIISEGVNSYGDGPERYVAEVFGATSEDLAIILSAPESALREREAEQRYMSAVKGRRDFRTALREARAQLTTERQAWAKVRAEIEALCDPDPDPEGSLPSDEYLRAMNKALAILAQHTGQPVAQEGR